jgi:uncharacterized membrane protein YcaP (DUF421 family)
MDTVIKATIVYFALWAIIRISGRRTLGEMTAFDFVLFLIIGGATQRALTGQDYSLINAFLLVATFVVIDVLLSLVERSSRSARRILKGEPMIVLEHGKLLTERMRAARVTEDDILESARKLQGLERFDQIKFAILEASGHITIVPDVPARPVTPRKRKAK